MKHSTKKEKASDLIFRQPDINNNKEAILQLFDKIQSEIKKRNNSGASEDINTCNENSDATDDIRTNNEGVMNG